MMQFAPSALLAQEAEEQRVELEEALSTLAANGEELDAQLREAEAREQAVSKKGWESISVSL